MIATALARVDQELAAAAPSRVMQQSIQAGPVLALKSFAVNVDMRTTLAFGDDAFEDGTEGDP